MAQLAERMLLKPGGPRFESSRRQFFKVNMITVNCRKVENEEKEFAKGPLTNLKINVWAVVATQLAERSLPLPVVRGLNPVIVKIL